MFYTIYKTTNKINGKIYIGKHQTKDLSDKYIGSGKRLWNSIKKHGIENFEKEILFVFDNEDEMNAKEAELVTEEFVKEDTNYNLCPGGKGGFGYLNNNGISINLKEQWKNNRETMLENCRANGKIQGQKTVKNRLSRGLSPWGNIPGDSFRGKTHTKDVKERIGKTNSIHQKGVGNSQYGTIWITNGLENKKIKKTDDIPEDWYKGRIIKNSPME